MLKRFNKVGPAAMVAAAFIGPGTVTTATIAGSSYGFTLIWAVLFSVLSTLVLQEMAARLGVCRQIGLGKAFRKKVPNPVIRGLLALLVISAIFVGNAAYEAGNITGAVLGLGYDEKQWPLSPWIPVTGALAFLLLWQGRYRVIERSLVFLVGIMGVVFLITALLVKPNLGSVIWALLIPSIPEGSLIMVVSLIGTTVVPYNLFLHAAASAKRWRPDELASARLDTLISVLGGGLITMAILIAAAVALSPEGKTINNISDLSLQLVPLLGHWSATFMSMGFLAAGLSSAITAPLAAAFATAEILGWSSDIKGPRFRMVWTLVLLSGLLLSSLNFQPTRVILLAQFANGLLLPVLAGLLVWIMNDQNLLGKSVNNRANNLAGAAVILITIILGVKSIASITGYWF